MDLDPILVTGLQKIASASPYIYYLIKFYQCRSSTRQQMKKWIGESTEKTFNAKDEIFEKFTDCLFGLLNVFKIIFSSLVPLSISLVLGNASLEYFVFLAITSSILIVLNQIKGQNLRRKEIIALFSSFIHIGNAGFILFYHNPWISPYLGFVLFSVLMFTLIFTTHHSTPLSDCARI